MNKLTGMDGFFEGGTIDAHTDFSDLGAHADRERNRYQFADLAERREARIGEDILYQIEQRGWAPPCSTHDLDRVHEDALRAIARDLPDPEHMARVIEQADPFVANCLADAYPSKLPGNCGQYRVRDEAAPLLRSLGIVEAGGVHLGSFGFEVREALLDLLEWGAPA